MPPITPTIIPPSTSEGKCTHRYMRAMPIVNAKIYAVQLHRLSPTRNTAVIEAKAAVVCPDGKLLSLSTFCPTSSHS